MLGVMTEDGFDGDEAVVSQLWNYIFFWNWGFKVHALLMMLLTNFLYLVIYVAFLFWDGASSFFIARIFVCFVCLRLHRGINAIFHCSMLLMVF